MKPRRLVALAAAAAMVGLVGMAPASLARFHRYRHDDRDVLDRPAPAAHGRRRRRRPDGDPELDTVHQRARVPGRVCERHLGSGYASIGTVTPVTATVDDGRPGVGTWYYVLRGPTRRWRHVSVGRRGKHHRRGVPRAPASRSVRRPGGHGGDEQRLPDRPRQRLRAQPLLPATPAAPGHASTLCWSTGRTPPVLGLRLRDARFASRRSTGSPCRRRWAPPARRVHTGSASSSPGTAAHVDRGPPGPVQHQGPDDVHDRRRRPTRGGARGRRPTCGTGSFRVRITDVSSNTGRRFDLDYLGVSVNYTP